MQTSSEQENTPAELPESAKPDAQPDPCLDRIARLTAGYFACPIAVVSLVGQDRVSFRSRIGLDCEGMPRDGWFCTSTILGREPLVVPDAARDAAYAGLPAVAGPPGIRFYAGAPLFSQDESALGVLAVMDTRPRDPLDPAQLDALKDFAALLSAEMDRRLAARDQPFAPGDPLSNLANALPAVVWVTDTEGNCTLLNRFEWDTAAQPAGGNGRDLLQIIPPDERDFEGKADLTFECQIPGPGGEDRWVLEQARPRYQPDGSFAGYIGFCLDITDRKRTEEALRETQEWLSLAEKAGGIGLWTWDMVNDSAKCTDQYFRLYDQEPRPSLNYDAWQRNVHPDDRMSASAFDTLVEQGGDELKFEFRCVWPDGSTHWLCTRARIYRDETGRAVRSLGANIDISGFKEAEARRDQAEKELIASREQLRQLAAHLESAREEERIRIAREIHDELGQILTVLKMDLEAVEARYRTTVPRPLKDITRRVAAMVKNLDLMIDSVRRISSELRPGILDHLGISAAIEWQLQETEARTGIRCRGIGLPERLPLDGSQSTAVFRIFQEMLTNVVRHAEASGIRVELRVDDGWMTLQVADNGRGFDPSRVAEQDALGLLGMRERALLLGGSVALESQSGRGTVATLRVPVPSKTV